jgi:glutamyl-tRNA reductase
VSFISVGVDHEFAPLDLLERASVPEESWGKVLGSLIANANIDEAVFVSTCLRTEVYATIGRFHGAIDEITATLSAATGVPVDELSESLTIHFDRGVAAHLFRVAAGLKSAVPGEFEVLGQLRRALERADEEHAVGPELAELFTRSLAAGRRARHETTISRGTTSFAHATVELAERELGDELDGAGVLILGAGQIAGGVARSLRDGHRHPSTVVVANRTIARAEALCHSLGDDRFVARGLDDAAESARHARLVIAAAESDRPLLSAAGLEGMVGDVLIIDLGMPRVVARDVDGLPGVRRLDISNLRVVVERTLQDRRDAIDEAGAIVEAEVERFHEDQRSRGAAAIVGLLRERLEELRAKELMRRRGDLGSLSDEQIEMVESLTRSIVAKIAHAPTVALKEAAGTDRGLRLTEATRNLFDL